MEQARIVVVEDEHIVALDIKMHLQKYGYTVPGMFASGEELLDSLEALKPDLVLMDIKLQGKLDGLETSKIIKEKYRIPVILLTAFADEATLERAKKIEPFGYIIKPFEEKELRTTIVIALYKYKIEQKLRDREELLATTLNSIADAVLVVDNDGRIEYINPVAETLLDTKFDSVINKKMEDAVDLKETATIDIQNRYKDVYDLRSRQGVFHVERTISPLISDKGTHSGTVVILHDITEKLSTDKALREREDQLRQSQKMEAIGRLAGGIAHDFNNLLTVIMGYSKLISEDEGAGGLVRSNIEGIQQAALKSVSLTRQLLTFSRHQVMELKTINLNGLIAEMEKMFRRLISEETSITISLDATQPQIFVDQGQIEQVLVNLVVNARDAITDSGSLFIRTKNVEVEQGFPSCMGVIPPGKYVTLAVRDTGCGMSPELISKIFDPFFTTKESGKGTGLGLSTVYGIIQQSSGYITVESEPAKGTIFQLYLPLHAGAEDPVVVRTEPVTELAGTETILLVEDEEHVRNLMSLILIKQGYHVIEAQNAGEALLICEENKNKIHLLITDIILPHVNGSRLAKRLYAMRPDLKIMFVSGYPLKLIKERNLLQEGDIFIQKPFDVDSFTRKIRNVLDT
jgi:PAS domain S-box-containing protein